jgi:hypothetical protein
MVFVKYFFIRKNRMKLLYYLLLLWIVTLKGYTPHTDRILCIVNYNWAYYDTIPLLKKLYEPFFPHMVFYGPQEHPSVHHIDHFRGYFGYKTVIDAMERYPEYDGYFFMNDDCMINVNNFRNLDCNKVWFIPPNIVQYSEKLIRNNWHWWGTIWGFYALRSSYTELSTPFIEQIESHIGRGKTVWAWSDVVYIPKRHKESFIAIGSVFSKHNLFLEIATPNLCAYLDSPANWEILNGRYLWNKDRENLYSLYRPTHHFIHPVKLSNPQHVKWVFDQLEHQYGQ